ncbi:MAG: DUF1461 domain-containing protein [Candidatus Nanoarchaeia archaeon]|nr:DUF1461 domain-containing protein [Candidatus Nanoarchaeia archaeon]
MKKDFLIGLLIAFFLILLSFNILLNCNHFHKKLIEEYNDNPYFLEINKNVTKYITGLSSELDVDFSDDEKSHMKDVRNLILLEEFIFIIFSIAFFVLVYKRKIKINHIKKSTLIIFFIGFLCIITSLFFNTFFKLFHLIFFPQGNWQFLPSSLMIQVYQQSFFQNFFIATIALSVFIALIIHLISMVINHPQ